MQRLIRFLPLLLPAVAACSWPSPPASTSCSEIQIPTAPAGAITVDGDPDDWQAAGITPLLKRAPGTATKAGSFRVDAFYGAVDRGKLYLRIDAAPPDAGLIGSNAELGVFVKTLGDRIAQVSFQPPGFNHSGCGRPGQACCNFNTCLEGGCCANSNTCVSKGSSCGNADVCQDGSCGSCGGEGQSCCSGAINGCTAPSTICSNECVHCGRVGEPCCGGPLSCEEALRCENSVCGAASAASFEQPCNCENGSCSSNDQQWTCSGSWNGNDGPRPSLDGAVAATSAAGSIVLEAWFSTRDFDSVVSFYPVADHLVECQNNCPEPAAEDEIGCVWSRWAAGSGSLPDARGPDAR